MHINNVSAKTSIKFILIFTLFAGLYTAGTILAYVYLSGYAEKSISGFFSWVAFSFDALSIANPEDPWISWMLFIILPAIFYIGLIIAIIQRYAGLKELASSLNLKSVDFLPDRVKFNFNQPQYNFVCGYGEIKKLEMVLNTIIVRSKYSSYVALSEVELNFTVMNNKNFSLKNTPLKPVNFIYKVIDYGRMANSFSYRFAGVGEQADLKEKIEDYLHKGIKPVLTSTQELNFKWMSIVFFTIGLIFTIAFKDTLDDCLMRGFWVPFAFIGGFVGVSFIFDIILIIDKIKEKNFRGYNG